MAKTKISEFSATPANNTDIDSINIAEGCAPSGINDAIRELMAQLKDFQTGAQGDSFNGPVGTSTAAAGAFTNITASGTLGVTGVATLGAGAILNTPASVTLTNATGLPISTGVSGLGTGVATALAVNVGSAGAPVLFNGALGTPSSGTVTNLTGTASININGTVGATTASTGAFTTLSASSTVTLSGGTANGVAYLNGSKVVTSGSALTFDTARLSFIKASNGRAWSADGDDLFAIENSTSANADFRTSTTGATYLMFSDTDARARGYVAYLHSSDAMPFAVAGSEQMRLTSTGLGLGTSSPAGRVHAVNTYSNTSDATIIAGGNIPGINIRANGGARMSMFSNYATADSTSFLTSTGGANPSTEVMRFDHSNGNLLVPTGNLGLGVTPSAWNSSFRAMQLGNSGYLFGRSSQTQMEMGNNAVFDATDTRWEYITTNTAQRYLQDATSGSHQWFTAASGTAGNAITFTQAMTLTAAGKLFVNTTSGFIGVSNVKVDVGGRYNSGISGVGSYSFGAADGGGAFVINDTSNGSTEVERMRIDSSGNLLVGNTSVLDYGKITIKYAGSTENGISITPNDGTSTTGYIVFENESNTRIGSITRATTTNAVLYNTTSDYRLKTVTGSVIGQGARIDALKPIDYQWTDGGQQARGFLAHEFQTVYPNSVTGDKDAVDANGNPKYQSMQAATSEVIADLVAEIQSLRKRLADAGIA